MRTLLEFCHKFDLFHKAIFVVWTPFFLIHTIFLDVTSKTKNCHQHFSNSTSLSFEEYTTHTAAHAVIDTTFRTLKPNSPRQQLWLLWRPSEFWQKEIYHLNTFHKILSRKWLRPNKFTSYRRCKPFDAKCQWFCRYLVRTPFDRGATLLKIWHLSQEHCKWIFKPFFHPLVCHVVVLWEGFYHFMSQMILSGRILQESCLECK